MGSLNGNIAPAVDVEFYGDIADNPPSKDEVINQLGELLDVLEEHYRTKPIIYTTYTVYYTYLKDEFEAYPLWIRNVYYQPLFSPGDRWVLWQYTDTAVLEGYEGTEQCIDMNVFRGTEEEWEKLLVQHCAEDRSREEVNSIEESGKQYGEWKPDLADNDFVDAVRQADDYEAGPISHTYRADYDGDGSEEAFVIVGETIDMWGDASKDQITGDMWFVDRDKNAVYLQKASFAAWQEYIVQDGKIYLFVSHDIGLPWITDIYTVEDGEAVVCAEETAHRYMHLSENGQVIAIQDEYDGGYDILDKFGWSGHTWKPYTFIFEHGELTEIPAKEVTSDDVVQIAALSDSVILHTMRMKTAHGS